MKECGQQKALHHIFDGIGLIEFGQSYVIAHQYGKGAMGRDRQKHADEAGGKTIIQYITDVFERGKPHTDHYRIYNTIKRLIEGPVAISIPPQHYILAAFFT